MLAVKAKLENGSLKWLEQPPEVNADVLVVFSFEVEPAMRTDTNWDELFPPMVDTLSWKFNREEANER